MSMKSRLSRDVLFWVGVMILFLSSPLFMTYLPDMGELEFYFCPNDGVRGPFLTIPLLMYQAGMEKLLICQIYIFTINLFTCFGSWYAFTYITENEYAGLAGSLSYSFSVYSMMIRYDRGLLGEMTAYACIPLVICGMWGLIRKDKKEICRWAWISTAGLSGVLYSSVPIGMMVYIMIALSGVFFFTEQKEEKRWLWWAAVILLPILICWSVLRPWTEHMGGSMAVAGCVGEFFLSYRIRAVLVSVWSVVVACLGRYIHDNRRNRMSVFMIAVVALQVCSGIYYMNEILYSTDPHNAVREEYAPEEFLMYINR